MSTANVQPVAVRNIDVPSHVPSHTQTAAKCADFRFRVFTAETDWLCSARERARFARSLPLADGFDAIKAYLAAIGRSPTAFCACELRSPTQFRCGSRARRQPRQNIGTGG